MPYDLDTLYFASALSRAAYLVVFLVVALRQPRELCLWHWIGAILASMGGSLIMTEASTTRWLTSGEALVAYTLYGASLTLSWSGLRLFNRRPVALSVVTLMTLLPGTVYVFALSLGVPMRVALSVVIALCSFYAALGAFEAIRRAPTQRLWSAYIVSVTLASYALMLFTTFAMLVGTDMPMNSTESGMLSMIIDQVSGILIYFGYIAMAKEQSVLTIERLAETDPLTGLTNRRGLQTSFAKLCRDSRSDPQTGILLVDIDHFKSINDTFGHDAGDAVLVAFSRRLQATLRDGDLVSRWGGEEFLVILPETDARTRDTVAERLRHVTQANPFVLPGGASIQITVSIGTGAISNIADEFERAARQADRALYEAKRSGRNRVCAAPFATSDTTSQECPA